MNRILIYLHYTFGLYNLRHILGIGPQLLQESLDKSSVSFMTVIKE
jgi:predicted glycosyltransferase